MCNVPDNWELAASRTCQEVQKVSVSTYAPSNSTVRHSRNSAFDRVWRMRPRVRCRSRVGLRAVLSSRILRLCQSLRLLLRLKLDQLSVSRAAERQVLDCDRFLQLSEMLLVQSYPHQSSRMFATKTCSPFYNLNHSAADSTSSHHQSMSHGKQPIIPAWVSLKALAMHRGPH